MHTGLTKIFDEQNTVFRRKNFIGKFFDFSNYIFAQNIRCGYTLEPPRRFTIVGHKGVFIARTSYPGE